MSRRRLIILAMGVLATLLGVVGEASPVDGEPTMPALREGGCYILLRHALTEPGTGDPHGFRLDDRSTQRNLSEAGRRQARAIDAALREQGVRIDATWTSPWFRCRDTAELIAGDDEIVPAFGSFFGSEDPDAKSKATRAMLAELRPLGQGRNVLVVTHQVNVTALTDIVPAMGEAVVVRAGRDGERPEVVGRIDLARQIPASKPSKEP